jgi:hypothetical protein
MNFNLIRIRKLNKSVKHTNKHRGVVWKGELVV